MLYFLLKMSGNLEDLKTRILSAKETGKELFYNDTGSKTAYQLGVKHLGSAEFLGFADCLPNGKLRAKKTFLLVDFKASEIITVKKGSLITPVKLQSC